MNIALPKPLLDRIDRTARSESRTRSEFVREASRLYIARKERWKAIFKFGRRQAKRLGLKESDVGAAVATVRRARPPR
ncbi:MAG: CopG family ribbon-helix-helix protein [Candidatus Rokuibacteriota bacterium]